MNQVGEGAAVAGGEGRLKEEGFVWCDGKAKLGANDVCKLDDGVRKGGDVGVGLGGGRVRRGGGEEGAIGEGGVVVDEREEQRGAARHQMDGESEGEGDAEVVQRDGLVFTYEGRQQGARSPSDRWRCKEQGSRWCYARRS